MLHIHIKRCAEKFDMAGHVSHECGIKILYIIKLISLLLLR